MFPSFFKKYKQNEKLTLLVDVGSASIGAALVEIDSAGHPHVIVTAREDILPQEKLTALQLMRTMNQALGRTLKVVQAKTKNTGAPTHILCSLSSPWFLLKSRHITAERPQPFEITAVVLDQLLSEEITRIKEGLKDTLPPEDVRIIERKIIQTKLNGYEIKNPYGQKASRVEIAITVGISSKQATERIEHTIANFFHTKGVQFGAFPVAAFNAIRDIYPTEGAFLFLDITGEGTDISLIENSVLVDTVTFPRGKNFFIREISSQFRVPHDVAASVLNMFLGSTLDHKRQKEVELLMARIGGDWFARLEKMLILLGVPRNAPHKVFFMADADMAVIFENMLKKVSEGSGGKNSFDVQYIDSRILEKFASFEGEVIRDPFLTIEALLAAKIIPQFKK